MVDLNFLRSEFIPKGLVLTQAPGSASQREPHVGNHMENGFAHLSNEAIGPAVGLGKNVVWALPVLPGVCNHGGSSALFHVTLQSHCHHVLGGHFIPSSAQCILHFM